MGPKLFLDGVRAGAALVLLLSRSQLKVSFADRVLCLFIQLLVLPLSSLELWRSPQQRFIFLGLTMAWGLCAGVNSGRLYHQPSRLARGMGTAQFLLAAGLVWEAIRDYAAACYYCYGHFAWNPWR